MSPSCTPNAKKVNKNKGIQTVERSEQKFVPDTKEFVLFVTVWSLSCRTDLGEASMIIRAY